MRYKILLLSFFVCSISWASVGVMRFPSGTPVQVCAPNDTGTGCVIPSGVNWSQMPTVASSGINWNSIVPNANTNWAGLTTINGTGVNWQAFYPTAGTNWQDLKTISSTNWQDIQTLSTSQTITGAKTFNVQPVIAGLNWTDIPSLKGNNTFGGNGTFGGKLTTAVPTTSYASLLLSSSSAVNPSTPVSGDLWWNGTNLNFYNGSTTKDLLAGSGGASLSANQTFTGNNWFNNNNTVVGNGAGAATALDTFTVQTGSTGGFTVNGNSSSYVSVYPPAQNGTYVTATFYSGTYYPYQATDPTKSLTGSYFGNSWDTYPNTTNQALHIDLGGAYAITQIYYENCHHYGTQTNAGAKDFTFWGSNTAGDFSDTTYADNGTWVQLTTSPTQFVQHVSADQADPHYVTVTNTTAYRYYRVKIANNWGGVEINLRRISLQLAGSGSTFTIANGGSASYQVQTSSASGITTIQNNGNTAATISSTGGTTLATGSGVTGGASGTGTTSCLCKTYSGGICTVIGTCT